MQKLIVIMDEEYPVLEYLVAMPPIEAGDIPIAILPETLQASSTTSTPPRAGRLCYPDRISTTREYCGPRHTQSLYAQPIHLLPSKYSAPVAFIYAPAGDDRDQILPRCPQP